MKEKQSSKQKGGFARAAALTPERRKEISRNAVLKRWAKYADEKKAGINPASEVEQISSANTSDSPVHPAT